jgi:hypothetical protein
MQKKILGGLFVLLLGGVSLLLYKLLNQSIEVKMDTAKIQPSTALEPKNDSTNSTWVKELAHQDTKEFMFPVNELFIQVDSPVLAVAAKGKAYRLVIDKLDRYSLFCIVQTLSLLNVPYMIVKEEKIPLIYVQEKSANSLENVLRELEKYNIKSKIVEVGL